MTKADADMALSIILRNQVLILRALMKNTERSDERSALHEGGERHPELDQLTANQSSPVTAALENARWQPTCSIAIQFMGAGPPAVDILKAARGCRAALESSKVTQMFRANHVLAANG